jgi:hypothetical protein
MHSEFQYAIFTVTFIIVDQLFEKVLQSRESHVNTAMRDHRTFPEEDV